MTQTYLGGVKRDGKTGKFIDTGNEPTKVLGIRLPVSIIEEINQYPDKSDWLKQVLCEAVESRNG